MSATRPLPTWRRRRRRSPGSTVYLHSAQAAVEQLSASQLLVIAHLAAGGSPGELLERTGWSAQRYWAESVAAHQLLRSQLLASSGAQPPREPRPPHASGR